MRNFTLGPVIFYLYFRRCIRSPKASSRIDASAFRDTSTSISTLGTHQPLHSHQHPRLILTLSTILTLILTPIFTQLTPAHSPDYCDSDGYTYPYLSSFSRFSQFLARKPLDILLTLATLALLRYYYARCILQYAISRDSPYTSFRLHFPTLNLTDTPESSACPTSL